MIHSVWEGARRAADRVLNWRRCAEERVAAISPVPAPPARLLRWAGGDLVTERCRLRGHPCCRPQ